MAITGFVLSLGALAVIIASALSMSLSLWHSLVAVVAVAGAMFCRNGLNAAAEGRATNRSLATAGMAIGWATFAAVPVGVLILVVLLPLF
jgi:hypothetical protein